MTGPLPANWTTGQQYTAAAQDLVESSVNALYTFSVKTANYTVTSADHCIVGDATSGAITLTLPTAVGRTGIQFIFEKVDSTANVVTVATTSSQTIGSQTSKLLVQQFQRISVISNGSNWLPLYDNYSGMELGYAVTSTSATTTNAAVTNTALVANSISGLSITTVGTGRPVRVEFNGQAYNSTANAFNVATLLTNGSTVGGSSAAGSSPASPYYHSLYFQSRQVLTAGTSYTFTVGMWTLSGTTATFYADNTTPQPMTLSVVGQ